MAILARFAAVPGADLEAGRITAHLQHEGVDAEAHYDLRTDTYTVSTPVTPDTRAARVMSQLLGR